MCPKMDNPHFGVSFKGKPKKRNWPCCLVSPILRHTREPPGARAIPLRSRRLAEVLPKDLPRAEARRPLAAPHPAQQHQPRPNSPTSEVAEGAEFGARPRNAMLRGRKRSLPSVCLDGQTPRAQSPLARTPASWRCTRQYSWPSQQTIGRKAEPRCSGFLKVPAPNYISPLQDPYVGAKTVEQQVQVLS